jgi:hypothetical protein
MAKSAMPSFEFQVPSFKWKRETKTLGIKEA